MILRDLPHLGTAFMALRARQARRGDLPRIVDIYNASIPSGRSTGDIEPVRVETTVEWFRSHQAGNRPLWVLGCERTIVGWAGLCSFYGRPAFEKTAELSVYVAPEDQGRGFGHQLVRRVMARCPALGVTTLLAYLFAHNVACERLLQGLGFTRWGLLPAVAEVYSVRRDVLILGKALRC